MKNFGMAFCVVGLLAGCMTAETDVATDTDEPAEEEDMVPSTVWPEGYDDGSSLGADTSEASDEPEAPVGEQPAQEAIVGCSTTSWFISPTGTDSNEGRDAAHPKKTLRSVLARVEALRAATGQPFNVDVTVMHGTYAGQSVDWTYNPGRCAVRIHGEAGFPRPTFTGCTGDTDASCVWGVAINEGLDADFRTSGSFLQAKYRNFTLSDVRITKYRSGIALRGATNARIENVAFYNIGDGFLRDKTVSSNFVISLKGTTDSVVSRCTFEKVFDAGTQRYVKTSSGWVPTSHGSPRTIYMHNFYVIRSSRNTFVGNRFMNNNCDIKLRDGSSDNVFDSNVFEKAVSDFYGRVGPFLNSESSGECESRANVLVNNQLFGDIHCHQFANLAWSGVDGGSTCDGDTRPLWVNRSGDPINVGASSSQIRDVGAGPRGLCR